MITQNIALWVLGLVALVYIAWIDVRPWYKTWYFRRYGLVTRRINLMSYQSEISVGGQPVTIYKFYFPVFNVRHDGKTIKNVKAILQSPFDIVECPILNSERKSIDIHSGQSAQFYIGRSLSNKPAIFSVGPTLEIDKEFARCELGNLTNGFRALDFGSLRYQLFGPSNQDGSEIELSIVIFSENNPAQSFDMKVRNDDDPLKIVSIRDRRGVIYPPQGLAGIAVKTPR